MTEQSKNYEELIRVTKYLKEVQKNLSLNDPISTDLISGNSKLNARLNLDKGFYECTILIRISGEVDTEQSFRIESYPIPEFYAVLSIISPLIQKIEYLSTNPAFMTSYITKDIIQDLRMCEEILTVRRFLTNSECFPDWDSAFDQESPKNPSLFISVFPFRDSLYVTVYHVKESTEHTVCELHNNADPFTFAQNSVIKIKDKYYTVLQSMIAKQSQQFLAQTLRGIRDSIEELETLTALEPQKSIIRSNSDNENENSP